MRIALLHTGSEAGSRDPTGRMVEDLASALAARGNDVTLIGAPEGTDAAGVTTVTVRRLPRVRGLDWYEPELAATAGVLWHLVRGDYQVAHAFQPAHAWAAVRAAPLGSPPTILSLQRIPDRRYLVGRRYRLEMLRAAAASCVATTVPNEAAAAFFRTYLHMDPVVLRPGLALDRSQTEVGRARTPTVICGSGSGMGDEARGLALAAFELLRRERAEARLLMAEPEPAAAPPEGVVWPRIRSRAELVALMAGAWTALSPDAGDATMLGALEALACGTPVVMPATAGAEPFADGQIGVAFKPQDRESLADAMNRALDRGADPEVRRACRERAEPFAWERVLHDYEGLYRAAVDG
jgi:glycosyltransferase involved in cell wall biosynthesis